MNRKETTQFLSDLLVIERLSGMGKYYAKEVSIDYGTSDVKRVDFMQYEPQSTVSISALEKGIFICYEVKSCIEDFHSQNGHNFIAEKGYYVMPMEVLKAVTTEIPHNIGVICPIPRYSTWQAEWDNPTPLDAPDINWSMHIVRSCLIQTRKKSMVEWLFSMLRAKGNN